MGSNHLATIRDYNSEELNRPSHPTLQHPTIIHSTVSNEICREEFWRQSGLKEVVEDGLSTKI